MNIAQIKTYIGEDSLTLVRQKDLEGKDTVWLSAWNNKARKRVTMHEDVLKAIKSEPNFNRLAVKEEVVEARPATADKPAREAYTRYVVITPTNIVDVL